MDDLTGFPTAVYLDTSIAVAALFEGVAHHDAARGFCDGMIRNKSRICFSQLVHLELLQAIRTFATVVGTLPESTRRRYRLARWDRDLDVRTRWLTDGVDRFDTLLADFEYVYEIPMRSDDWRNSIALMCRYHLKSYDAYHAATALALGVYDFATIDAHFTRVAELNVHLIRDPQPADQ